MSVEDFETFLRNQMLLDKFRAIITDGISVNPAEIEQEFRRRNEKAQIEYALVKPTELARTIHPTDAELNGYYQKNASRYQIPEKRSARYALLDLAKLRARTHVDDGALRAYYNSHSEEYKVQNRARVEHILFKTIGKTDAEVAEIRAQQVAMARNIDQPYRNAGSGPKQSRTYTYKPPASGLIAASSP